MGLPKTFHQGNRFQGMFLRGQLGGRGVEVRQHRFGRSLMLLMEGDQLVEDIAPRLQAGMRHDLPAGDDQVGQSAETRGNLDVGSRGSLPSAFQRSAKPRK